MAKGKKTGEGIGPLGNEDRQSQLRKEQKTERDFRLADLEAVLLTEEGRRFFYRLIFEVCAVLDPSFELAVKDGVAMGHIAAHQDGRRAVGSMLALEVKTHFPDLWVRVVQDELTRIAADAASSTNQSAGD